MQIDTPRPAPAPSSPMMDALGGYIALTAAVPLMILLLLLFVFLAMCVLVTISGKLNNISKQLEDLNMNTIRGPLPPETYSHLQKEEAHKQKTEAKTKTRLQHSASGITAGILLGLCALAWGYYGVQDDVWRIFFMSIGALTTTSSVVYFCVAPNNKTEENNTSQAKENREQQQ